MLKPIDQETMKLVSCDENACKQWKFLARALPLKDTVVTTIEYENKEGIRERCYQSLEKWRKEKGSAASIRKLLRALTQEGLRDVALKLSNKLMESDDGQH